MLQINSSTGELVPIQTPRGSQMSPVDLELAQFIEQVPISIAIFDVDMCYVAVSRRFISETAFLFDARLFTPAEVIGRSHWELFPGMPLRWREIHSRVMAGAELAEQEDALPHREGAQRIRWSMTPWRAASGTIGGALLVMEVITEQIEAKRSLAESEARFRATFENAGVGIAHLSPELGWLRANAAFCRITGWPIDELLKKSLRDISHAEDFAQQLDYIGQMRLGKIDGYKLDKRFIRKDGTTTWGRLTASSVLAGDGSIDYFVHVLEDISAQKHAERLLQRQADLLDQSHDAIFTWKIDSNGITYWNHGAEVLYGYSREEAIGRISHALLQTRSDLSNEERDAQTARTGSWRGELSHTTRDGREIVVESRQVRVPYDGEIHTLETNRDITARKRAEAELRESEERFRSSVLHSPAPTVLFDGREQILAVSQSWLDAAGGIPAAELRQIEDWTIRAYGDRSDEMLGLIREIIATKPMARSDEMTVLTRDNDKRVWNFVTSCLGTLSDGRCLFVTVAKDITDRKAYEEEIQLLMREARHRTKNVLSLVQAIARQTAGDEHEFLGRFTERIQALAANQDLMVRHDWRRVEVKDLVQGQLGHFSDLIGTRINFSGPNLNLNAAAAQAIGLALHELATNAGKYGALSTETGRVDVNWQLHEDNYVMSWIERNGPRVRAPQRRGFGTTVIESTARQTLGGEVRLHYAPSGLEWHLTCPAAAALAG